VLQVASSAPQLGQEAAHKAAQRRKQQIVFALRKYKAAAKRAAEQPSDEAAGQGGQSSSIESLQHAASDSKVAGGMLPYKSKITQRNEVKGSCHNPLSALRPHMSCALSSPLHALALPCANKTVCQSKTRTPGRSKEADPPWRSLDQK